MRFGSISTAELIAYWRHFWFALDSQISPLYLIDQMKQFEFISFFVVVRNENERVFEVLFIT